MRHEIQSTRSPSYPVLTVFALYTAGFYVYSLLVFNGMSPFLRGYVVWAGALSIPLLAIPYSKVLFGRNSHWALDFLMWVFLTYLLLWMLLIEADKNHPIEFNNYIGTLATWAMLFMLGRVLPIYARGVKPLSLLVFALMLAATLAYTEEGAFVPAQSPDTFANYQAYAVVLAIVSFTLMYEIEMELAFWIVALVAVISFAILGSRSEFIAMLFAAIAIANLRRISLTGIGLQIVAAGVIYIFYRMLMSTEWNRFQDLADGAAESTLSSRAEINSAAIATILDSPLAGQFGSYEEGFYAHNILSIWVDFGIIGFGLYVLMMLWSIVAVLIGTSTSLRDRRNVVAIGIWAFCAILLATTKSGHYAVVPFMLGLLASHRVVTRGQAASQIHNSDLSRGRGS